MVEKTASFGLMAAKALEDGKLDGFWANGMGAEVAVRKGIGTVVLDARRDGSEEARGYTFPALVCTEKDGREKPEIARRGERREGGAGCAENDPGARVRGRQAALPADRGRD